MQFTSHKCKPQKHQNKNKTQNKSLPLWDLLTYRNLSNEVCLQPTVGQTLLILQQTLNSPCFFFTQQMSIEHVPFPLHIEHVPLLVSSHSKQFIYFFHIEIVNFLTLRSLHTFYPPQRTSLQEVFSHAHTASGGTHLTVLLSPASHSVRRQQSIDFLWTNYRGLNFLIPNS